jgi:putative endopeptidase
MVGRTSTMSVRRFLLATGVAAAVAGGVAQQRALSGLDRRAFDAAVRPQDDLYRHVNGGWIASTPMPADRVTYGTLPELADRAELDLRAIIEGILATPNRKPGSEAQQIADLYASMTDVDTIERLGAAPIQPELKKIDAIQTTKALAAEAGYLSSIAAGGPFDGVVGEDPAAPGTLVFQLVQGGTLLADRDYYLRADPASVDLRAKYVEYLTTTFALAGRSHAAADAAAVLALETELARAEWPRADPRDAATPGHRVQLTDLPKTLPGFDWIAWAKPQGLDRVGAVIVSQPSFFRTFAALVQTTPLTTWKAWLAIRYITATSSSLSQPFERARFEFFGRVLVNQDVPRARWKRAVGLVSTYLPDAIGRRYVEARFPPSAKLRAEQIVGRIADAYRRAMSTLDWMSPSSRRQALAKLAALRTKVGYPEDWHSYRGLVIRPDDLVGNQQRWRVFDNEARMGRMAAGAGADRRDWLIAPQVVNANYNAARNEIVVPAAMLQPPLFNPEPDDAVNYGGIGAIVGHEIGHAFDAHGRFYDATGRMRDWWTPQDVREFETRARALIAQFNACTPLPGVHVNGSLTLDENLGDLGGLSIAYQAYELSLDGRPSPVIDGLTGEQRFFAGWAQAWRTKSSDGYVRQMLLVDPHAPPEFRTNGPLGNLQAFYDAFGVKAGDRLYREQGARVTIW